MAASAPQSDFDLVLGQFRSFDVDGSGTLGRGELSTVLRQLQPALWTDEKVAQLFMSIDRNGDGTIQFEEFLSWLFADAVADERAAFGEEMALDHTLNGGPESPAAAPPYVMSVRMNEHGHRLEAFYEVGDCIGEGEFATVHRARNRATGQLVAVKSLVKDELSRMKRQGAAARLAVRERPVVLAHGIREHIGSLEYPGDRVVRLDVACCLTGQVSVTRTARVRAQLRRGQGIIHTADVFELTLRQDLGAAEASAQVDRVFPTRDALVFRGRCGDYCDFELLVNADEDQDDPEPDICALEFSAKLFTNAQAREAAILQSIDHPNIVKVWDIFEDFRNLHFCMELCEGGELFDAIVAAGHLEEKQAAAIMRQTVSAVQYMHAQQLMHRDLRLENLMLQQPGPLDRSRVKIIDLGCARSFPAVGTYYSTKVGSAHYMSPQVVEGRYNEACDVWSLGVACHILLSGRPPFDGETDLGVWAQIRAGNLSFDNAHWAKVSPQAKDLVALCLQRAPSARVSAAQARLHKWLEGTPAARGRSLPSDMMHNMRNFWEASQLKKAALCVLAKQMDARKAEELQELFERLDVNRTGELTYSELRMAFESADVGLGTGTAGWRTWMERTFGPEVNLADGGERRIHYTTFLACTVDRRAFEEESACWQAFRAFDRDGNGQISAKELGEVLRDSGVEVAMGKAAVDAFSQQVDLDGDGQIDFWEFVEALRAKPHRNPECAASFAVALPSLGKADLGIRRSPFNANRLCVQHVRQFGALDEWNQRQAVGPQPEAQVQPGDEIVSVNGVSNDPEGMLAELRKCEQGLHMSIVRWKPGSFPERRAA